MKALVLFAALAMACASAPPPEPKTVVVERKVYVFVPEQSVPMPPGEGIAPSPLLIESERQRADAYVRREAVRPPPETTVVYVDESLGYGYGWRDPYPSGYYGGAVVVDHPRHHRGHEHHGDHVEHHGNGKRHHEKASPNERRRMERAADRCDRRGTQTARDRCYRGAAKR